MGRRSKQTILQRRHRDGQKTYEKMFNSTHDQRHTNQNHSEVPPYTSQNGHHQKVQTISAREGVQKKEHQYTVAGTVNWCSHCGKTVWRFLRKLKIELPFDPAIPLLGIYPKKTMTQKDTCISVFIAALHTIAKTWKQPNCPLTEERIKKM